MKQWHIGRLLAYGFEQTPMGYRYQTALLAGDFHLLIAIDGESGELTSELLDAETQSAYTLHLASDATGAYIGQVKSEYEQVLTSIQQQCSQQQVFKSQQAQALIEVANRRYHTALEFLWAKSPPTAVLRRPETGKWYAVMTRLAANKLGLEHEELVEIVILHQTKECVSELLTQVGYYPAYHMNKQRWYAVILDETISTTQLVERLNQSFELAR